MQPLHFCLFSHYFSTNTTTAATSAETKYAFILYAVEMWENRPQIASCLWLERGKKRFHSTRAKMPVYFYSRNSTATFILQNKFFLHTFSRQRNASRILYTLLYWGNSHCIALILYCNYLHTYLSPQTQHPGSRKIYYSSLYGMEKADEYST